jgi:predicted RNA-binding Zn-ribbon protein involved in translation (DUF1610 family)
MDYSTRDPKPRTRDPRIFVPASPPTVCPKCGAHTTMKDGRRVDREAGRIVEYRTCTACGRRLAAGRPMTEHERQNEFRDSE